MSEIAKIKNNITSGDFQLGDSISEIRNNKMSNMNVEVEYLDDLDSVTNSFESEIYVVGKDVNGKSFSTLWDISQDSGVSIEDIKKANPSIGDNNIIHPGQEIIVPIKKDEVISAEDEVISESDVNLNDETVADTVLPSGENNERTAISSVDVPSNLNQTGIIPNYTNYEYFYGKWNKGTMQSELSELWASQGKNSDRGIATIDDNYLVAVSPKFGKAGDKIDVVLEDGTSINCIIADVKGGDAGSEWGHSFGESGIDIIEWESLGKQDTIELGDWKGKDVAKIINYGSYKG